MRQTENTLDGGIRMMIVQANLYVIQNAQVLEQANVLEGSCNTCLINLDGALSGQFLAIQEDRAVICLVDTGQQIEDGGLTCAIRSDEAVKLSLFDGQAEIVNCL